MSKSENLIRNLMVLPHEYEWLDFKESWFSKDEIGEYISAISNGAAFPSVRTFPFSITRLFTKRF